MIINEQKLQKVGLSPSEFFTLLSVKIDGTLNLAMNGLYNKKLIVGNNKSIACTHKAVDIIDYVISNNEKEVKGNYFDFNILAEKLQGVFPNIPQPSTGRNVRSNIEEIVSALKNFDTIYSIKCTDNQIIEATTRYIEHFNGDFRYILTIPDFIYTTSFRTGEFKRHSELADYLSSGNSEFLKINRSISR